MRVESLGFWFVEVAGFFAGEDLAAEDGFDVGGEVEALGAFDADDLDFDGAVGLDGDVEFLDLHGGV